MFTHSHLFTGGLVKLYLGLWPQIYLSWQLYTVLPGYASISVSWTHSFVLKYFHWLPFWFFFFKTIQLGIAIINDFKSIEGDRALGLQVFLKIFMFLHFILILLYLRVRITLSSMHLILTFKWLYCLKQSLPVIFGMDTAKWICVSAIDMTQISIAGKLFMHFVGYLFFFFSVFHFCLLMNL